MNAKLITIVVVALALIAGISLYALAPEEGQLDYRMSVVERGDLESVVVSTGTLAALNTVVVGSQLSGQVAELHADFNDTVAAGQIIARIDPRTFEARVRQNRADVTVSKANITSRKADLSRTTATLRQAERELKRRRSLEQKGHISASELDRDLTLVETSAALVVVARSAIANAEAVLEQRMAALAQSELDLERTYIRSPVSGTVINRQIEIGQTVAASFSAPELFQIGQDLHRMKVEASIDEADIGRIREGMSCRFTVDAYPERRFVGRIQQIRKAPDLVQNVVTYKVIITADNNDLALLPGMTANVEIVLGSKSGVLRVANAALRFVPKGARDKIPNAGSQPSRGSGGNDGRRRNPIDTVREQIDLRPEQSAELDKISARQRENMRNAFQSGGGDRDAMRARMQTIRANMRQDIESILDADQLGKLNAIQEGRSGQRRATVWVMDASSELTSKLVVLGLQDDAATEVIEGLDAGEQVIVRATRRP